MKARSFAYNTRRKSSAQLEQELVGAERWDILNSILKELSLDKSEPPKQHWLITGPRGIGKSHLLTLLYYKVKSDERLSKQWITVLFPEELRMANDLAKFLERAVNEILLELERDQNPFSAELKKEIIKVREIPAAERSAYLFNLLNWIHQTTGRFVLLIIENLQQLLGKKISEIDQKKLRAFLQTHDSILIISSATSVFNVLHDHKHPFYHFFHIRRLNDMTFDEMKSLIANLMGESGRAQVMTSISKNEARLRAIHSFTGGNPRMAVFLSEILKTDVPDEMLDFMDQLLDELNPYFEAILNDTPDYMEEVMNTLAIFEPAQSPKEIADHLEAEQSTIRNYLKQMKGVGYVRVAFSKGNSNFYCLNEYLYRIWYQMRDSSHREETRWIMELLMMLYSPAAITEEMNRLSACIPGVISDSYKELIYKTADFMYKNPGYCKVIEWCVDSALMDAKDETVRKMINQANKYLIEKKFEKALKLFNKLSALVPTSSELFLAWGNCLMQLKDYYEADEKIKKAIELKPTYAAAHSAWGDSLRLSGRYVEAEQKYIRAIELDPTFADAFWGWGDCLRELGNYENAINKFQKAVEFKPNFEAAFGAWGDCLRHMKQYSEAEEKYNKAISVDSNYEDAYIGLSANYIEQKKYNDAIENLRKLIEVNPRSEDAYYLWSSCLIDQARYDDAIEKIRKVLEINPRSVQAYGMWGSCLRMQRKFDEAIKKLDKVLELNPKAEQAFIEIGACLLDQKQYSDAIEACKKALKINPLSENAYGLWGACLGEQGLYDDAIIKFKKVLEIDSASLQALKGWIRALVEGERYDEAILAIEGQSEPKDCLIIFLYGKCLLKKGRYSEALDQFRKLLNIHQDCWRVYMLYGEAMEKLGDKESALSAYLTHTALMSEESYIDFNFRNIYEQQMAPILSTLNPEDYIKQIYSETDNSQINKPQVCTLSLLLDRYDIVMAKLQGIAVEFIGKDEKERFDFDIMIFAIKLKIWLTLTEEKIYEALKLTEFFSSYVTLLKTEKEKEDAVSKFILGIFKLQTHFNVKAEYTFKILESLKKAGVPFNALFFKVWTCLSEPDSIDAQRHLTDRAIAELVEQIKSKEPEKDLAC